MAEEKKKTKTKKAMRNKLRSVLKKMKNSNGTTSLKNQTEKSR